MSESENCSLRPNFSNSKMSFTVIVPFSVSKKANELVIEDKPDEKREELLNERINIISKFLIHDKDFVFRYFGLIEDFSIYCKY